MSASVRRVQTIDPWRGIQPRFESLVVAGPSRFALTVAAATGHPIRVPITRTHIKGKQPRDSRPDIRSTLWSANPDRHKHAFTSTPDTSLTHSLASIPSPSHNGFSIGPLFVHAYGLMYVVGVVAAIAIARRRWERLGGDRQLVYEVAMWGFPAGIIGGRIYFLVTSWDQAPHTWWGPLAVWQGGLGIWGGIAAGTAAGVWVLHRRRAGIPLFLDAAAPALLVAQSIGRVGNYFNQELFGGPTGLPWALHIDLAHRPAAYAAYSTFHPTFLYEIVWNLSLAGLLVLLGRTGRVRPPGLFALYVAGYSGFRIFEETLRVDPAHHVLGLRLNFFVASVLCAGGLAWFARTQRGAWKMRGATLLAAGWLIASLAGCAQSLHH